MHRRCNGAEKLASFLGLFNMSIPLWTACFLIVISLASTAQAEFKAGAYSKNIDPKKFPLATRSIGSGNRSLQGLSCSKTARPKLRSPSSTIA